LEHVRNIMGNTNGLRARGRACFATAKGAIE
jgi:hypothetical protein